MFKVTEYAALMIQSLYLEFFPETDQNTFLIFFHLETV